MVESQTAKYTRGFPIVIAIKVSSKRVLEYLHWFLTLCLQMEEEDLSERGLPQIASIMNKVRDLKNKYRNEDNITDELNCTKFSADTTGMWLCSSLVTYATDLNLD